MTKPVIDVAVGQDADSKEVFILLQISLGTDADFRLKLAPKDATAVGKLLTNAGFKGSLKSKPAIVIPS